MRFGKAIILLFAALLPCGLLSAADTLKAPQMALHVDGSLFFVDNEYGGNRIDGYTLPGFVLRPTVEWRLDKRVSLNGGLNWIHFWGNNGFPEGRLNEVWPAATDSTRQVNITPGLQARVEFTPWLTMVMGSLVNEDGHGMPTPLYNSERLYASDPEAGMQFLVDTRYLKADMWVDWREFIWHFSPVNEVFNAGLSLTPQLPLGDRWMVSLPLHGLVQHRGGEGLSDTTLTRTNYLNASAGLAVQYTRGAFSLSAEGHAMHYSRSGGPEGVLIYDEWGCLKSEPLNYKRGWSAYGLLHVSLQEAEAALSYWTSEKFVPLMGSYLYSNVSSNTASLTFDRIELLSASLRHTWRFASCSAVLECSYYRVFPTTGDRKDYWKCTIDGQNLFSVGAFVKFNPTVPLVR